MSYSEHYYRSKDGLKLYFRTYGSGGEAVLCLPGLTRNCKDFEDLAGHLSRQWQVITPDLRGRGKSQWDPRPARYHLRSYARDVWQLLGERGVDRPVVIGTSLGGLIAMVMADQRPERLRGIVLNDIGPEIPPQAISRILQYAGRRPTLDDWNAAAAHMRKLHEMSYPGMPDDFWLSYVRRSYRENAEGRPEPDMDPAIGDVLRKPPTPHRFMGWLNRHGLRRRWGGAAIDPWDNFRAVAMPCLLLHGVLSDVLTHDIVERMLEVKPDLEVVRVPGRGHVPLLDEPASRSAIDRFLQRVPGT